MTCNQLILLDIRRGTFSESRHLGTVQKDLFMLRAHGFIDDARECTDKGNKFCNLILEHGKLLMEG